MEYPENIKIFTDIAIAIFTAALVWATLILAKHTKIMSARDAERLRIEDIKRCISLAQLIVRSDPKELGDWSDGLSSASVRPFNELLALGKYIHDSDTKRLLENVTSSLTTALIENIFIINMDVTLQGNLNTLRQRLVQEIIELQRTLGNYSR